MSVHEVDSSSPDVDKHYCTCEDVFRFGPDRWHDGRVDREADDF